MPKMTLMVMIVLLSGLALITPHCQSQTVTGVWISSPVTIDGSRSDWPMAPTQLQDSPATIGIGNDSEYLYFSLATADRRLVRQIRRRGLVIKIETRAASKKLFGVRFPVGLDAPPGMSPDEGRSGARNAEESSQTPRRRPERTDWNPDQLPSFPALSEVFEMDYLLLGPGRDDQQIVPLASTPDLQIKMGIVQREMVYEAKFPLDYINRQIGIDQLQPGAEIRLTLEIPPFQRPGSRDSERPAGDLPGRRGGPGGNRGPMGAPGGMRDGMDGPGDRPDRSMQQTSFKYEMRVRLATAGPQTAG